MFAVAHPRQVMQVLVAEGWRLRVPESQDMWSDSEEEEGGWH